MQLNKEESSLDFRLSLCVLFSGAALGITGFFLFEGRESLVCLLTILFSLMVYFWSRLLIKKIIFEKKKKIFTFLLFIKMILTGGFILLLSWLEPESILGILVGCSVVPLALIFLILAYPFSKS